MIMRFSDKEYIGGSYIAPNDAQCSLTAEYLAAITIIQWRIVVRVAVYMMPRRPVKNEITASTRNTKNRSWAMLAADPAIPLKPRNAATIAMMKNVMA
jgi:hypothetical protein